MYDVIVPVATRCNASSVIRNNASGFKTEYLFKIILLQFLLMRVKANECTFATSLNFQNDAPRRRDAPVGNRSAYHTKL